MVSLGLASALQVFSQKKAESQDRLRKLGKRLQWPKDVIQQGKAPSTWFIAKSSGSKSLYNFIYHATSRYVHCNAVELARRGWGSQGQLVMSSKSYEPIWALFSLEWATRLFGWTLIDALDALTKEGVPEPDHEAIQSAFDKIMSVVMTPLVTPDELVWKDRSA